MSIAELESRDVQLEVGPGGGLWSDAWQRLRRNPAALLGFGLVGLFVIVAVFAPLIAPYDPIAVNVSDALEGPSPRHLFGTDDLGRDVMSPVAPSAAVQQILVDVYRRDAKNAELCERLVDLDEGMQEWRYRHVKMVERTIGARPGTGGSSGTAYLRTTIGQNLFPDLWDIRTRL